MTGNASKVRHVVRFAHELDAATKTFEKEYEAGKEHMHTFDQ